MAGKVYMGGEDYEKEFTPKDYLTTFYSFDSGTVAEQEIVKFSLQNLYQTFSTGEWLRSPREGLELYQQKELILYIQMLQK